MNKKMKHLEEIHMSYFKHLFFTWKMALALFIHGLVPSLFTTYVSDKLRNRFEQK
jgi:hypothetical protein